MALGPFVLHVFEWSEIFHYSDVALDLIEGSAHGSVDPIFRDQDPPLEVVGLAQCALPQTYRLGIGEGRELVEENDFLWSDLAILTAEISDPFSDSLVFGPFLLEFDHALMRSCSEGDRCCQISGLSTERRQHDFRSIHGEMPLMFLLIRSAHWGGRFVGNQESFLVAATGS